MQVSTINYRNTFYKRVNLKIEIRVDFYFMTFSFPVISDVKNPLSLKISMEQLMETAVLHEELSKFSFETCI